MKTGTAHEMGGDAQARDLALWLRLQTGDEAAFESLFRDHAAPLCDFALSLLGDADAARDIIQVLFCRLWEQRHTLEVPRVVRAYLFVAVRNRCHNHLRDARVSAAFLHRVASSDEIAPQSAPRPDETTDAHLFEDALTRELAALPLRCREVFSLIRYQGMRHSEVAAALGIAQKTVEIHLGRALKILRVRLAPWLDR